MRPMVNPQGKNVGFGKPHGRNNLGQIDGGRKGRGVTGPGPPGQLRATRTAIGINPAPRGPKDKAPGRMNLSAITPLRSQAGYSFKTFWERRPWTCAIFSGLQAAGACKDAARDLRSAPPIARRPFFACREASPYPQVAPDKRRFP